MAYVEYDHSGAWLRGHFWNSVSGQKVAELSQREVAVFSEVVTTGATLIAIGRRDGILELRDSSTGRPVIRKRAHDSSIVAIAVDANRSRTATVAEDASIHIFCPESHDTFVVLDDNRVADLALSPDGRSLATVSEEGTLCLWDVSTGRRRTCIRHREALTGVEFTPDGAYLLTASRLNKVVRIHDAQSLDVRTTIDIRKHDRFPTAQDVVLVTNEQEIVDQVWSHALLHALSRDAFYAFSDANQFVVVDALDGTPVAWFPTALRGLVAHPNGRRWAGRRAADVYLLELETEG